MINKECQQIVKPDGSKQLQAIPDTAVDGIITTDKHGIVRSFNVAAEQIFGYTSKEIIGKNIKILMAKPFQGQHDDFLWKFNENYSPFSSINLDKILSI